jgi:hypothetical protein
VALPPPIPADYTAAVASTPTVALAATDVLVEDEHGNQFRLVLQDQPVLGKGVHCTRYSICHLGTTRVSDPDPHGSALI